ncbi:MAG TPA: hypothetical protein VK003_11110 [Oceanobacillus sp.]|nr:hypothetical protein [Oceanobacillus sp.]
MIDAHARMEQFRNQIQEKIMKSLTEFSEGKLSREQFHAIYEHYDVQLKMAEQALQAGKAENIGAAQGQTFAVRQAHMGKAIGLLIYHNKSGLLLDTLGHFDIPTERISPILNDFSMMMEARVMVDRRVEKMAEKQWLLLAAGRYTTIVTLFQNEPSQEQVREIERLHHDFEVANEVHLSAPSVDSSRLAYPFLVFIQQRFSPRPKA